MAIVTGDVAGWWDLEEGTGTTAADKVGSHDGTISGATWVTGGPTNLPNGLSFNKINQVVTTGWNPNQAPGTACVWFIADSTTGSPFEVIFGEGNGGGGGGFDMFIEGNALKGRVRYASDITVQWTTGSGFAASTLYFASLSWDVGSGQTMRLRVNGVERDTAPTSGTIGGGTVPLCIGSNAALSREFGGDVFQAILFNRQLTDTEIDDLYNSGAGKTYAQAFGGGGTVLPRFLPHISL